MENLTAEDEDDEGKIQQKKMKINMKMKKMKLMMKKNNQDPKG